MIKTKKIKERIMREIIAIVFSSPFSFVICAMFYLFLKFCLYTNKFFMVVFPCSFLLSYRFVVLIDIYI